MKRFRWNVLLRVKIRAFRVNSLEANNLGANIVVNAL